jgi:hypothetical protein
VTGSFSSRDASSGQREESKLRSNTVQIATEAESCQTRREEAAPAPEA